jgi:hypothetical protein
MLARRFMEDQQMTITSDKIDSTPLSFISEPDFIGIFEDNSEWTFASPGICKTKNVFPNMLAFSETQATLCLIVKRSTTGDDFALSEAGLEYLLATLDKGARKDGKVVRQAFVILADVDLQAGSLRLKVISHSTAQQTRERLKGIEPNPGRFSGPYWWIKQEDQQEDLDNF